MILILHSGSYTLYEHIRIEIPLNQKWYQHIRKSIEDTLGGILVTQSESVPKLHLMLTDMSYSAVWKSVTEKVKILLQVLFLSVL